MGNRLNWQQRQGPGDFDDTAPTKPTYEFDLRRNTIPGGQSWSAKIQSETFGPSFIAKTWKTGLLVIAEVAGLPHPVAVTETRWGKGKILQVRVSGNWVVPERLSTRRTVKGLDSTGLLIEGEQ